jgi:hypothetical protein
MNELLQQWRKDLDGYRQKIEEYQAKGIENLDYEDTEFYGAYLGKEELLTEIISKLESLK